jgi:hypothetical protein
MVTLIAIVLATSAAVAADAPPSVPVRFTDVTRQAGIDFVHVNGASGRKYYVETMGSGACWIDHDSDGDIDLYVVNSGALPGFTTGAPTTGRLYENRGDGTFRDITQRAGLAHPGYGMGCAAGDVENDGDLDLFVTRFGDNVLYRNDGGGFTDVTGRAGIAGSGWSTSAAFADIENDGDLDLYVAAYIDFTLDNNKFCGEPGLRAYCHPDAYNGLPDRLYVNRGDGTFEDASARAGVASPLGKGLGVVFTDIDADGFADAYVANDKTINFLYRNRGDATFADISLASGAGLSEQGAPQAGMGVDAGDVNGDGRFDLIVTNLDYETNELYLNNGDRTFADATFPSGLGAADFLNVGWGVDFLDYDLDGDRDLAIVNGHILDNAHLFNDQTLHAQPRSMLDNDGMGRFREVGPALGEAFTRPAVGRGLAVGDYDDDGDLDLFIVNNNAPAELLRNEMSAPGRHWLSLALRGTRSNRFGVGARVEVVTRDGDGTPRRQADEVRAGSSYLSQNDLRLHFGLGSARAAERVEIRWPSGTLQILSDVAADRVLVVQEPAGEGGNSANK